MSPERCTDTIAVGARGGRALVDLQQDGGRGPRGADRPELPQRRGDPLGGRAVGSPRRRRRRRSRPAAAPRRCRAPRRPRRGGARSSRSRPRCQAPAQGNAPRQTTTLTSFGSRTITLRTSRPSIAATTVGVGQGQRLQVGRGDVGGDLQPRPDLALDLDDGGDRLLDQQRRVDRPARRPARPTARDPAAPTSPRRRTAPPATAGSRPPRRPRAPRGRPGRSRSRSPCGWR